MGPLRRRIVATLTVLAAATGGLVAAAAPAEAACSADNVKIVVLRGTDEDQYGRLLSLVQSIEAATAYNATGKYIDYPSDGRPPYVNYGVDVGDGEQHLRDYLNAQYKACASTKYVLLGYSKGAHALGDALDKSGPQLSSGLNKQIKAVVLYGNPRFRSGQTYDRGTYANVGSLIGRPKDDLANYASRLRDYCLAKDAVCQGNLTDAGWTVHTRYFSTYNSSATSFVKSELGK